MRAHDWSTSPLGPPSAWPEGLRTAVGLMLPSRAPIALFWGPDHVALYNDAYAPVLGDGHPRALGRPAAEGSTEPWGGLGPLLRGVRETGEAVSAQDRPFRVGRQGHSEEVFFDVSCSPVHGAAGEVAGVLCVLGEATARVRAEAALRGSEARLRFMGDLDEALRAARDAPAAALAAAGHLARHLAASRCAYADVDADGDRFVIRGDAAAPGVASSAGAYSLDLFGPRAAADMRGGRTLVVRDVAGELAPGEGRETFRAIGIGATVCCPLVKGGRLVAMMAVHQDRPRDWRQEEIGLVEAAVERCWAHVERVGAEARLREGEARYRALFEAIDAGFCVVEVRFDAAGRPEDYRFVEVNPAFGRQTGLADAAGRWMRDLAPAHERHWFDTYGRVALTGEPARFENAAAALGRWYDVHAFRVGDPAARRVAILFNDISARRRAELGLRELNATLERRVAERTAELRLLATIVEVTDGQIQALGPDYRWLAINAACADAYERIYGRRPAVGDSLLELLADRPDHLAAARAVWARALAGEAFTTVAEWGDPALDRRTYEMRFEVLRGADGARIGAFLTGRDVTDRLREQARLAQAEEALRQSQKMEAVGQLTGGVAHDFNNLLTVIRSSTDLLRRPGLPEDRRRRYVDAISDTVDRAARLTGQLLAFARRQALRPEVFDPAARVRAVADMLRAVAGSRVRIAADAAREGCLVEADASQFETALVNMAANARDAMAGEGTLTIRVAPADAAPAARGRGGAAAGGFVAVSVTDTGHGIPGDRLAQVFEPFFTTKEVGKGTGLGLSQVYGFARQSGGDVAVESEVGRGSTFTLYLPRAAEGRAEAGAPGPRADGPAEEGRGRRVLVVEDNVEVGRSSTQVLEDLGYETAWAAGAEEALRLLDGAAGGFDVVFSDVVMPGMGGVELGREIRRRHPGLPVVLTSGYSHVLAAEGTHGFELLHKPYAAEELSRVLRRVAHGRGRDGAAHGP